MTTFIANDLLAVDRLGLLSSSVVMLEWI